MHRTGILTVVLKAEQLTMEATTLLFAILLAATGARVINVRLSPLKDENLIWGVVENEVITTRTESLSNINGNGAGNFEAIVFEKDNDLDEKRRLDLQDLEKIEDDKQEKTKPKNDVMIQIEHRNAIKVGCWANSTRVGNECWERHEEAYDE